MSSEQSGIKKIINSMQSGLQTGINSMQRQGNSIFYTSAIQQQKAEKCGWLKKQGGVVKSWHRRWFTIKGDHMFYFNTNDESKPPLGCIFLPGNKVIEYPLSGNEADKFIFEIIPGGDKDRMTLSHETYPLAAATEDERKEWVRIIRRVMYAEKGGAIFGQKLEETMRYEQMKYNRRVPEIVEMCVEFLNKHGVQMEGVFRLPGRTSLIRQLREMFDCGERPDFEQMNVDVNTVASLLKQYLRELPEPIIPTNLYEAVMKAVTRDLPVNRDEGLENLASALQLMPSYNYNLLQYICQFLSQIHRNCDVNKMTDTNLATVFAQCIIRPDEDDPALLMGTAGNRSKVVLILIQEVNTVFRIDYNADGTLVMVDNLLDIEESQPNFDVGTMSYFKMPASTSQDGDLLSSDSDTNKFIESLPDPLLPNSCDSDGSTTKSNTQSRSLSESNVQEQQHSMSGVDCLQKADVEDDDLSDSTTSDEEPALFGSTRAAQFRGTTSARLMHDANHNETNDTSIAGSDNMVPKPAPRRLKYQADQPPAKAIIADSALNDSDDDLIINSLTETDLSTFTREDFISFLETVFSELKQQRSKVKDLHRKLTEAKEEHRKEIEKLQVALDSERQSTAQAVQKVVALQSELQAYQMVSNQTLTK